MILDILASDTSVVGAADFTADGAVSDIAVNGVPGPSGLVFKNAVGFTKFVLGDNILVQKVWGVINWGFGAGGLTTTGPHNIGLAFWDGAAFVPMAPFPYVNRVINIPTLCHPVEFPDPGLFAPMNTVGAQRSINLSSLDLRVSQINLPAILQGQRIAVQYFLQVVHTYLMVP